MSTSHASVLPHRPAVPNAVLAMALFLFTEVMLFCALVSSFVVLRGRGAPMDLPRLPVAFTAFNTAVLLASGVVMWRSGGARATGQARRLLRLLQTTLVLGTAFLLLQGAEWVALLNHGFTARSRVFGGTLTAIVGCHALHVVAALVALGVMVARARRDRLSDDALRAMRMYWIFVVAVWPPLYALVFLW